MSEYKDIRPIHCWCVVRGDVSGGHDNAPYHYNPRKLFNSLIDYSKYLLKQVIYMDYLVESASCNPRRHHRPVYDQLIETLRMALLDLPTPEVAVQTRQIPQELVGMYTKYYTALFKDRYNNLSILDLVLAPNLDSKSAYVSCTESELSFLVPYLHTTNPSINITSHCQQDERGNWFFPNPSVLLPSSVDYVTGEYTVAITLTPMTLSTVYFLDNSTGQYTRDGSPIQLNGGRSKDMLGMLRNMDLSEYTADDLLALYLGTDFSEDSTILTSQVTDSINRILTLIFSIYHGNGLKVDTHQPLLAKCLAITGRVAPTDIAVEMLSLSPEKWTNEHKVAFRRSPLYSNLSTSLVAAIEAAGDETTEQASLDMDESMEDENIQVDQEVDDRLDVVMQLLELASPEEKFSDFMYRKLLAERMIRVIKNPPNSMSKAQIALLKSWLTHWINLVSIPSLKSFLNKFQFEFLGIKTYKLIGTKK